jgi:hypothetical protein
MSAAQALAGLATIAKELGQVIGYFVIADQAQTHSIALTAPISETSRKFQRNS